jgi:hypothetical protein
MSGLRVLDGKAFLNQDFEAVKLPARWMVGSCGGLLHPDPAVQAFRTAVPIYCGDFELSVSCMKRADARGVSFERFIASHLRRLLQSGGTEVPEDAPQRFHFRDEHSTQELAGMPEAKRATSYAESLSRRAPVDVLWEAANFGCLMWDWQRKSLEKLGPVPGLTRGVYAPAVDGSEFIPRIFTDTSPELTEAGIGELRRSAREGLRALPELRKGLSRSAMGKLINGDIDALAKLCRRYGTFGTAALPGAFDAITGLCLKARTGNEHEVFVETDAHFYFFSLFTS